jgi:formylglycine-generating enzyme required for sulfatase activity
VSEPRSPRRLLTHALRAAISAAWGLAFLNGPAAAPGAPLPPRHWSYTETIPDTDVKFDMVAVTGGVFQMGSPDSEKGRGKDEGPQHRVQVYSFWMGKCEVTWDEFDAFRRDAGVTDQNDQRKLLKKTPDAVTGPSPPYIDETWGYGRSGMPVISISHNAAMRYCWWLSKKTGKTYRLPTEAEWEYAARAGTNTAYSFGDDPKNLDDYAWYAGTSKSEGEAERHPHKVGTKKPNPWGLHDMYGNVAEYCLDHYDPGFYATLPLDLPALRPVVPPTDNCYSYVVRGGSWADAAAQCRSATRRASDRSWNRRDPYRPPSIWWLTDGDFVGFRVVRPLGDQDNLKDLRPRVTWDSR